jgi:flagellar M-ring protein FliF
MADARQAGPGDAKGGELARGGAAAGGLMERVSTAFEVLKERVMNIPAKRRTWLLGGVLFLAAAVAGLAWFMERPDWRVLFSGLDGKDIQTVSSELAAAGITFETTADGGGIQVPADLLDKARMEVAAKGMPQTGRLGFELFDKPNWVGSEFDERVNYQRAMEGELEHTIGSLGEVKSARVHLVLPQASLFTSEEKVAKASVVLRLRRSSLSQEQTDAIRSLVAGSVENLAPENVTLVDAEGRQNLQAKAGGSAAKADVEQAMEAKLIAMLEPLAGRDNVRATVNVSYDDGTLERTDDVYDPAQGATLSLHKSEQVSENKAVASGVPGTASNTPAAAPGGSVQAAGAAVAGGQPPLLKEALPVYPGGGGGTAQTMKEETGTYGVTHHVTRVEEGGGRVRRVTAAVVVNDRQVMEGAGKDAHLVWKPRSVEEMKRLEELTQAAVGYDTGRGDQVVMTNVSFSANAPEAKVPMLQNVMEQTKSLLREEPALARTGVMALIALGVILFVMRPVAQQVSAALRAPVLLAPGTELGTSAEMPALGDGSAEAAALGAGVEAVRLSDADLGLPSVAKTKATAQGQMLFERISEQISREPVTSTRLLEGWINGQDQDN